METKIQEIKRENQCCGKGFKVPVTDRIFRSIDAANYEYVCCYSLPCEFQKRYLERDFCVADSG